MGLNRQRKPRLQKRDVDGVILQTVGDCTEECITPCVSEAYYQRIVLADTENLRRTTLVYHIFNISKALLAVEHLDAIIMIPVATDDNLPAVQFQRRSQGALPLHTAEAVEGVGLGIVHFSQEGLADADRLFATSEKQHLSRLQDDRSGKVVVVHHLQHVPLTVLQVFSRRRGHKTVGMTACHRDLSIDTTEDVACPWNSQVSQTLRLDPDRPTGIRRLGFDTRQHYA